MTGLRRTPVVMIGAGFSKAISEEMPVLSELGDDIVKRFAADARLRRMLSQRDRKSIGAGRIPLGNVELWLSSLAAEQPFLSRPTNLQRRALFMEIAIQIAESIDERTFRATLHPLPDWLLRMLTIWHYGRSTVLTFNYDLLIESAVAFAGLPGGPGSGVVRPTHITGDLPPEFPAKGFYADEQHDTFTLRKLHGSTNWYGRSSSSDLFSIFRIDQLVPQWGDQPSAQRPALQALIYGNERMLLPPIADKTASYANPTTAAMWRAAHTAIAEATELVLIGYSVPLTDSSVLALLDDALGPRTLVTVVDRDARAVIARLGSVGISNVQGVTQPGTAEFDGLLLRMEQGVSARLDRRALTGINPRCYVEVVTPDRRRWSVLATERKHDGGTILEVANEPSDEGAATVHPSRESVRASAVSKVTRIRFANGRIALPFRALVDQNTSEHSHVRIQASLPTH
jgi:hypothetical protein